MDILEIIFRDEFLIAVNKPHGLLVHKTALATEANEFALQILRNQVGQHVFPAHRLDRKTSGALLFSMDKKTDSLIQPMFARGEISKTYLAIVRGFTDKTGTIDYPLKREDGKFQDAVTHYKTLATGELDIPSHTHPTSRYSLVEVKPETGRMHQIRRHFAHILHPIIGDRPHGCNKQNRFFKNHFHMDKMLLHASRLEFMHPLTGKKVDIYAPVGETFNRMHKTIFTLV